MTSRPRKARRASAPPHNSRLPQLRIPSLPDEKKARKDTVDAFLKRVKLAKGRKYHYTLHEWWHCPLPKVKDDSKGSIITSNVLEKVFGTYFCATYHHEMMESGYATKKMQSLPGKRYLIRPISLPEVLRFLVIEKEKSLKEMSELVPVWKARYARFVSTGSCGAPDDRLEERVVREEDVEVVVDADDADDMSNDGENSGIEPACTEMQPSEVEDEENVEKGLCTLSGSIDRHASAQVEEDDNLLTMSNAVSKAVLGSQRDLDLERQLRDDILRTPESVKQQTRDNMARDAFLEEIRDVISQSGMDVSISSQELLSEYLSDLSNRSVVNFKLIYKSWGDGVFQRNGRLREVLLSSSLRSEADLLVAVISMWLNPSSKNLQTESRDNRREEQQPITSNRSNVTEAINLIDDTEEDQIEPVVQTTNERGKRNVADARDLGDEEEIGDAKVLKKRRKSKNNINNIRSLLLVMFYSRRLGLAENIDDEVRNGIQRSFCSGFTLEELCDAKVLPLSRSMAFTYRRVGDEIIRIGKEKQIRKFEQRELLRLLLSNQTVDEIIKQEEIGGDTMTVKVLEKVLEFFEVDLALPRKAV